MRTRTMHHAIDIAIQLSISTHTEQSSSMEVSTVVFNGLIRVVMIAVRRHWMVNEDGDDTEACEQNREEAEAACM